MCATAEAVTAHILKVQIGAPPTLCSINMDVDRRILLVDLIAYDFDWEACASQVGDLDMRNKRTPKTKEFFKGFHVFKFSRSAIQNDS